MIRSELLRHLIQFEFKKLNHDYEMNRGDSGVTEYELSDLTSNALGNFLTSFTIFVTIITAYVIAAFAAGSRLTKLQTGVVNSCFLVSSTVMGILSVLIYGVFTRRAEAIAAIDSSSVATILDFTWAITSLYIILTTGGLLFMWNVRRLAEG
jgi:hypothetical protein